MMPAGVHRDPLTHDEFIGTLREKSAGAASIDARLFPAQFDPDPEMPVFMRSFSYAWESLAHALAALETHGLLVRIPLFWQCEPLIAAACRASGTYFFLNEEANMPVGRVALRDAGLDTALTTARDARRFAHHLRESRAPMPRWIIIHRVTEAIGASDLDTLGDSVTHEVHLVPGIPLLIQCPHLSGRAGIRFHLANGYTIEPDLTISGTAYDVSPLSRYRPPLPLTPKDACACGAQTYEYGI